MATAKKKRGYGTGSVYRRSSDGRWIGSLVIGFTETGGLRRRTVSGKTEVEARQALDALRRQVVRGEASGDTSGHVTVKAFADRYLELDRAKNSPNTHTTNRGIVRKWIVPTIGRKRLSLLTPADVRAVTDAQRDSGASVASLGRTHSVIRRMLKVARREGHEIPERTIATEPPAGASKTRGDRTAVPIVDMNRLIDATAGDPDGARWWVALTMALRQGEALGLRWSHVDLDGGVLDVSWQLDSLPYKVLRDPTSGFRVPHDHEAIHLIRSLHLTRPKTAAGQRFIYLEPIDLEILRRWRAYAPESPYDLVFPREDGEPRRDAADTAAWQSLQASLGIAHPSGRPYKLHEARNSTATLLLEAGVDPETVKSIMGHTAISMSRRYQTVSPALARSGRRAALGVLGR